MYILNLAYPAQALQSDEDPWISFLALREQGKTSASAT